MSYWKILRKSALALFISIWSIKGYALVCEATGSMKDAYYAISTTTAIPNSLAKDTVLWRQPTTTTTVECYVDIQTDFDEYVYFYVNPKKVNLGNDLEIGVTYNGKDYKYSTLAGGRLQTSIRLAACPSTGGCWDRRQKVSITYSVFFSKKAPAGDPREGALSPLPNYKAFQFDGENGPNSPGTYSLTITGLNKFRYIPCSSTLTVSPQTIDFGKIPAAQASVGKVSRNIPFTITETRNCTAAYGSNFYVSPVNATLDGTSTLVPRDNTSVGISMLDGISNNPIQLQKELTFSPTGSTGGRTRNFVAQLKWRTATPKLGKFSAGATVDIYYK